MTRLRAATLGSEKCIIGVDEAGRGPLAGPVYAAAVIVPRGFDVSCLDDSKKMSEKRREAAAALIYRDADWGIGTASHTEIDAINILQASLLAMRRAAWVLWGKISGKMASDDVTNSEIVVDGLYVPEMSEIPDAIKRRAVVKADALFPAVMAASILAKTARDAEMRRLAALYPGYGYEKHKGYPTQAHIEAIARLGPSPIQRVTFTYRAK